MKLTQAERKFIEPMRVARVATCDADGVLHNVPICPLLEDDKICFGTDGTSKKVSNIEAHPQITIVFDDYSEAWQYLRGIMIQGTARMVSKKDFLRLRKKIYTKYLHFEQMAPLTEDQAVIVEIQPTNKFAWGLG